MHGARHDQRNVLDPVHAERRLAELLGIAHLVKTLIFAFGKIHDVAGGRSADHDDRITVRSRLKQCRQSVEETGGGYGQGHRWPAGNESIGRGRVDRILLMAHTDVAHAHALGDAGEIGDRDADHTVHVPDAVLHQDPCKIVRGIGQILTLHVLVFVCHCYLQSKRQRHDCR